MKPYLVLASAPKGRADVPTLTRRDGVRELLEHPPYTRYEGWNLLTLGRATLERGERLSLANGARKFIDLYRDGTFVCFGMFEDFLAWHRGPVARVAKINSLATIEFVVNFALVYEQVLHMVQPAQEESRWLIGLRHAHFDGERVYLSPGPINSLDYEFDDYTRKYAPDPVFEATEDVQHHDPEAERYFDPEDVGYRLVSRLFTWFGFEEEDIPYADPVRQRVDLTPILNDP